MPFISAYFEPHLTDSRLFAPTHFLHGSCKKQAGWFWGGGGERAGRAIRASGSYREQGCQIAGVFMAASVTDNICRFVIPHPRTAAQHPPNIPQQRFSHLFSTAPKFCQVNMDVSWPWYLSVSCILDSYFLQELFLMLLLCPISMASWNRYNPTKFPKYVWLGWLQVCVYLFHLTLDHLFLTPCALLQQDFKEWEWHLWS